LRLRSKVGPFLTIHGSNKTSPKKQRKNATSKGCIACAAIRIKTFIVTAQIPLSRIHNAARVIGASRGAVSVKWMSGVPLAFQRGGQQ
jgi:hypothetical protein